MSRFLDLLEERIAAAEAYMLYALETQLFCPWLGGDEWREFNRSRAGGRWMMRELMRLADADPPRL